MTDLTRRLPVELLAEILGLTSALDALRFKQVNRAFRDVVLSSPLIQHKIELFAAGLEYNEAARIDVARSREAFHQYRSNLDSLHLTEERVVDRVRVPDCDSNSMVVGGVYASVKDPVRLFSLGSASRGIPYKEWEIPLPTTRAEGYGFYPNADVIAFIEPRETIDAQISIHLRTLSSGGCHPAARVPTIRYSREGASVDDPPFVSITSSRLAILIYVGRGTIMVIWDWRSGQVLFELENDRYDCMEFVDEHRLLVNLGSSKDKLPCIVLMDTEKDVGKAPSQTSFHFSPHSRGCGDPVVFLERGGHKPSPAESMAAFHQDPAQRIAVVAMQHPFGYLVFRVESLLRLVEDRQGSEIGWDEWKKHVVITSTHQLEVFGVWVSGCRLFFITSAEYGPAQMEVYDFSMRGRSKYLTGRINQNLGGVGYLAPAGNVQLPWDVDELVDMNGGHDSVLFFCTSNDSTGDDSEVEEGVLHVWTF